MTPHATTETVSALETKSAMPPLENKAAEQGPVRSALDDFATAFAAFKETNDDRLRQIEGRLGADVVTEEKLVSCAGSNGTAAGCGIGRDLAGSCGSLRCSSSGLEVLQSFGAAVQALQVQMAHFSGCSALLEQAFPLVGRANASAGGMIGTAGAKGPVFRQFARQY